MRNFKQHVETSFLISLGLNGGSTCTFMYFTCMMIDPYNIFFGSTTQASYHI